MKKIVLVFGILVFVVALTLYVVKGKIPNLPREEQSAEAQPLLTVGNEVIYQHDLQTELSNYAQNIDPEIRNILQEKLITDSVILQGGQEDGLIQLDSTMFNSPQKDYKKRIQAVETVKQTVEAQSKNLKGSVIAIWFRNNDYIGPLGLEKSKQKAFDTISDLHEKLQKKEITIQEAAEMIVADTSLRTVDKAWRNNAIFHFESDGTKPITISPEFDTMLKKLQPGEVTDVYLVQNVDVDTQKQYEALYYVGQVSERIDTGSGTNWNDWLIEKTKRYAATNT